MMVRSIKLTAGGDKPVAIFTDDNLPSTFGFASRGIVLSAGVSSAVSRSLNAMSPILGKPFKTSKTAFSWPICVSLMILSFIYGHQKGFGHPHWRQSERHRCSCGPPCPFY
jgi:hypothetical protein